VSIRREKQVTPPVLPMTSYVLPTFCYGQPNVRLRSDRWQRQRSMSMSYAPVRQTLKVLFISILMNPIPPADIPQLLRQTIKWVYIMDILLPMANLSPAKLSVLKESLNWGWNFTGFLI